MSRIPSNNLTINKIACIIDCQGFNYKKEFFPRELGIVSDEKFLLYPIDPEVPEHLKIHSFFAKKYIHGLSWKPTEFDISKSTFKSFLRVLIKALTSEDKPYIAVKNSQLAKVLEELEIDFVDLDISAIRTPRFHEFCTIYKNGDWLCPEHEEKFSTAVCAVKKCMFLWKHIKTLILNSKGIEMSNKN